ncbi:MAG: hypothetical protein ABFC89_02170 [Methanospirillum sp.]
MHISEERGPSTLPRYPRGGRTGTHENSGPPTATASVRAGAPDFARSLFNASALLDRLVAVEASIRDERHRQPDTVLEAIARLWTGGATVAETAAGAGVSPHIVRNRLQRAGVLGYLFRKRRRHVRDVLERQGPTLVAAYEDDTPLHILAAGAGISDQTLRNYMMARGIAIRDLRRRNREILEARAAELIAAYEAGATLTALGARTGVSDWAVRAFLADHGTAIRRSTPERARAVLEARGAELVAAYTAGASISALASRTEICQITLRRYLVAHGVAIRCHRRRTPVLSDARFRELIAEYEAGATLTDLAAEIGICDRTLRRWLIARGVAMSSPLRRRAWAVLQPRADELIAAYTAGATLKSLAAETGVIPRTVGRFLAARGVQLRQNCGGRPPRRSSGG